MPVVDGALPVAHAPAERWPVVRPPKLVQPRIPKPCPKRWSDLAPAAGGRHCEACRRTVVDGEQLTTAELGCLLEARGAEVCARLVFLSDGSLLTREHPQSALRHAAVAAGLVAVLACSGIACSPREAAVPVVPVVATTSPQAPDPDSARRAQIERLGTLSYFE